MGRRKGRRLPGGAKTDNHPAARAAKVDLRERVLAEVGAGRARVFDAFCGAGEMHEAVWSRASAYAGCDSRPWDPRDPPRFVADNRRLLRCLDLAQFSRCSCSPPAGAGRRASGAPSC